MKKTRYIDHAEMSLFRAGKLNPEYIIRETLLEIFQALRIRAGYTHALGSLDN
jgi:hypothetical protein